MPETTEAPTSYTENTGNTVNIENTVNTENTDNIGNTDNRKPVTTFEEELEKNGVLCWTNVGRSMLPLLRELRDVMVIEKKGDRPLRVYDAVLFRRPWITGRGAYVLHRILRVNSDGTYYIIGDNDPTGETVREDQILGVLTQVIRDGKTINVTDINYRLYVHLWCDSRLTRRILRKILRMLRYDV